MQHVLRLPFIRPRGRTHHSDLACSLLNIIFGQRLTVCRFRINLPNPLPFPCGRKVEKSNNKTISPYGLFKRGRLKTRHIFSPSNDLIGKCELAEHPVYVYDNEHRAGVAQSVEQRIRNAKVGGSIPFSGTRLHKERSSENLFFGFSDDLFSVLYFSFTSISNIQSYLPYFYPRRYIVD